MGKTLQYVKEFTFAKGGAVGACGDDMGYAKGGTVASCSPKSKMPAKPAYKKGGGVFEKATGETYPSRKAMVKHEAEETPRMKREELVKRESVKMPVRRMMPVAPREPMIAMKKGGAVPKAEGGKVDMAQDKAMIKKAFKQHDAQEHKGDTGTKLALKKGGMAKMMHGGMAMKKGGSASNC